MAFIPTPHAIRLSIQFVWAGQIVEVTLALLGTAPASEGDLVDLTNTANTSWQAHMLPLQSNQISLTGFTATAQDSSSAPSVIKTVTSTAGGHNGPSVPNNSAMTVSMRTPSRGRSYRGRMFLPGMPLDDVNTSVLWALSSIGSVLTAFASFVDDIKMSGLYKVGVLSTHSGGSPRSSGVFTEYNAYSIDQAINSMRRRLAGRGA